MTGINPQPGEISLAHNGVLFLDELPEFKRTVLEVMRQPMEDRCVTISRAKFSVEYPASFMLVASMNPCPCGYYNHPEKDCVCAPGIVQKYLNKISGPLLDRIDIHIEVTPVPFSELSKQRSAEKSVAIRTRVIAAREIQKRRFEKNEGVYSNSQMTTKMLQIYCDLDEALKYDSKNAEAHILKGDALLDLHPTEGGPAIKEYEEAQKLNPKSPKAVLRQGKLFLRARNYQLALDKYKEAEKIDPTFAPAYIEKAELYHMANQDNNAVESAKKYLELNGNSIYAKGRYAGFLYENKQYAEAVKQIEEIQQKDTSNASLYRIAGYSYDEMGNKTDTAAYVKGLKAITVFFRKTSGKNFNYIADDYKHKGILLSKTGKDSLGVMELQKAIDLDPIKNCELFSEIGKIWMKAKKYDKAIAAYEKLPACGKTLTGQNYYDLGRAYYYGPKDFVKADTAFSKLIQASPAYPLGYFWRGKVNVQIDAKNEKWLAKPFYEKGLELIKPEERAANKSNVVEACSYLGYYYVKQLKDNEKAKQYWTIVKELDHNNEKANNFFKSLSGGK